jgi:hypothetical protein
VAAVNLGTGFKTILLKQQEGDIEKEESQFNSKGSSFPFTRTDQPELKLNVKG